ncbi:T9SS type A sorting domain-containing protein [Chryseobacterium sp. PS-8]|uniref:T9SS type A sorting domain-containing protein n=1 Tax=Chryseobacterium indicum TaxID=2766954 RepID=A0ABS9C6X2_9FLAO|nr:T9SS type A sorting domain-containing protein [Chryseobacterium sp. PS-8]MCF2220309.1 T9SS type A sorting domain-containing protein [Chryseobacterium sp. PS-8]
MKKNFLLFVILMFSWINGQTWQNIGGNENYGGYAGNSGSGYYSSVGVYSKENLPSFYELPYSFGTEKASLTWNVNNNLIYVYDVFNDTIHFSVFDTNIKQWKKLNSSSIQSYGTKGVESPTNFPGKRIGSLTWVDNDGNLWLYGNSYWPKQTDLWKYNTQTNMWTWISGTQNDSSLLPPQNTPTNTALPKTYANSYTWVDAQNNLWFFGGGPFTLQSYSSINQVWKYNTSTNKWTWMKGDNDSDYNDTQPVYGTENVENSSNTPGEFYMYKGASWQSGNYVYFLPADGIPVLWRYNMQTNNWCYVKKPSNTATMFNYGTLGVENPANFPASVYQPCSWIDSTGNFWLFGGQVTNADNYTSNVGKQAFLNTLWKYNPNTNQWTWMRGANPTDYVENVNSVYDKPYSPGYYGIKNIEDPLNMPHSRNFAISWFKNNELFFGYGAYYNNDGIVDASYIFRDIWKYSISSNNFTWIGGRSSGVTEYHKNKLIPDVENYPMVSNFINDESGNIYGFHQIRKNEIWKYSIANKTWVMLKEYSSTINYGVIGVENSTNAPYNAKNIWYYGNNIYFISSESDYSNVVSLWKFDLSTHNYTCIKKVTDPTLGTVNVENSTNFPYPINQSANVVIDNKLYMLGGHTSAYFWEYNPVSNNWRRLNTIPNISKIESPSYGLDSRKNLWVFGGSITNNSNLSGFTNDVWKFDYSTKTWQQMQGGGIDKTGYYGTQNLSTNQTRPGSRSPSAFWMDKYDRLWIYSGVGFGENTGSSTNILFDLWYYDTKLNAWFWGDGYKTSFNLSNIELHYYDENRPICSSNQYENRNSFNWNNGFYYIGPSLVSTNYSTNQIWKLDTSNILPQYSFIEGYTRFNINGGNCDNLTTPFTGLKLKAQNNNGTFSESLSNQQGYYRIILNNLPQTTLTPELENPQYFNVTPSTVNVSFNNGNSFIQDFCITPNGTHNDLEVKIIPLNQARPGFVANYKIVYFNKGNTILSGSVNVSYPNNKVVYQSSMPVFDTHQNNILTWDFTNLAPFQQKEILVNFTVNTPTNPTSPVNVGDILSFTSNILPVANDETPNDNTFGLRQTVVNSVDPNDKICLEGTAIDQSMAGNYLTYLIRFENTGTANAVNITLKDVIDTTKFDVESIKPKSASHPYRMIINDGNKMQVFFENIQLPFQPADQRHGYFLFKIKSKASISAGDILRNKAEIYFDYNSPVITNEYQTLVQGSLSTNEILDDVNLTLYPNPVSGVLNIKAKEQIKKVEIFDASGRLVKIVIGNDNLINVSEFKTGNYLIKINTTQKIYTTKFVKK